MQKMLVCSVGGSPAPVAYSIARHAPGSVCFVASLSSSDIIPEILRMSGYSGEHTLCLLDDAQDISRCAASLARVVAEHPEWNTCARAGSLVVDLTGGTKAMITALALTFAEIPVVFSYVGGAVRNKGGLGIVASGTETLVLCRNPRCGEA